MSISPIQIYEIKNQVCPIFNQFVSLAVGNNQQVIAGIAAKSIRIMGGIFQANGGGPGVISLLNGSGGAVQMTIGVPASTVAPNLPFFMPIADSGYFETSTGIGLFANITTGACQFNVFYIDYTS